MTARFVRDFPPSIPLTIPTLSHADVHTNDQFADEAEALVNWNVPEAGANGPPPGPVKVKPVAGEILRPLVEAVMLVVVPVPLPEPASALIRAAPLGVPQPVQRSYPATAG